jgi:hypothetical protein
LSAYLSKNYFFVKNHTNFVLNKRFWKEIYSPHYINILQVIIIHNNDIIINYRIIIFNNLTIDIFYYLHNMIIFLFSFKIFRYIAMYNYIIYNNTDNTFVHYFENFSETSMPKTFFEII